MCVRQLKRFSRLTALSLLFALVTPPACAIAQSDPPSVPFDTLGTQYIQGNVSRLASTPTSFFLSLDRSNDGIDFYRIDLRKDVAASMTAVIRQSVKSQLPVGLFYTEANESTADIAAVLLELRPTFIAGNPNQESVIQRSLPTTYGQAHDIPDVDIELEPEPLPQPDSSEDFERLQDVQIQMGRIKKAEPCGPVPHGSLVKVIAGIGVAGGPTPYPAHFFRLEFDVFDAAGSSVIQGSAPKTLGPGETDVLALNARLNVPTGTYKFKVVVSYYDLTTGTSVTLDEHECPVIVQARRLPNSVEPLPSAE